MQAVERRDEGETYSVSEAARLMGLAPKTVLRWIDEGRLRAVKQPHGRRYYFRVPCSEVQRLGVVHPPERPRYVRLLTLQEAAERLGVSEKTIRRYLHSGRLRGFKRGTLRSDRWVVPSAEVERLAPGMVLRARQRPSVS